MTDTFKLISQNELTAGANATLLATGASGTDPDGTIVRHMRVVNNSGANGFFKMWHTQGNVPTTIGTFSDDVIVPRVQVDAGGWAEFEGTIILNDGEFLYGIADAGADLTFSVYGLEMT